MLFALRCHGFVVFSLGFMTTVIELAAYHEFQRNCKKVNKKHNAHINVWVKSIFKSMLSFFFVRS